MRKVVLACDCIKTALSIVCLLWNSSGRENCAHFFHCTGMTVFIDNSFLHWPTHVKKHMKNQSTKLYSYYYIQGIFLKHNGRALQHFDLLQMSFMPYTTFHGMYSAIPIFLSERIKQFLPLFATSQCSRLCIE